VANEPTPTVRRLLALPRSERAEALETLVCDEFRASLLMDNDDELPLDESYFDLGLTSLRLTELKQRVEDLLGCAIDTNAVFNRPTVRQLLGYLTDDLLSEIFTPEVETAGRGRRYSP
jgi:acyl carrier protein